MQGLPDAQREALILVGMGGVPHSHAAFSSCSFDTLNLVASGTSDGLVSGTTQDTQGVGWPCWGVAIAS
jgi:hypothetical protein